MNRNWNIIGLSLLLLSVFLLSGCAKEAHQNIQVTSNPTGALIYFDNEEIGTTPFEATIDGQSGDYNFYKFRATKDEYLTKHKIYKEELYYQTVQDVVPEDVHFELKKRNKHSINITSEPSGASVVVGGVESGTTPFTLIIMQSLEEPQAFSFYAVKTGYMRSSQTITEVVSDEDEEIYELPESVHFELDKKE